MLKKLVALLIVTTGSFGMVAAAPALTLKSIPSAVCITPKRILYEKHINASGTIEAQNVREIYLETPVIAKSVHVEVGDAVSEGDTLAVIDADLTKGVLAQSVPAASVIGSLAADPQAADLLGLYASLQGSSLGAGLGSIDDLIQQAYGALETSIPEQSNPYIYIPEAVTAPMDGVVTQVGIKSNMLTRTAKPVVTISDPGSFAAMVTVGESYASDVKVGDPATIKGSGFTKVYHGHVSKIYPVAHKITSGAAQETVVDLEIAIEDADEGLKAGFTVRAEITTGQSREMMTIPYEAIRQDENNVEYVYLADGSVPVRQDVETGQELLEGVEITGGLTQEDLLLADASVGEGAPRVHLKRG